MMPKKGTGLNSIPTRFGIMSAATGSISIAALLYVQESFSLNIHSGLFIIAAIGFPALITIMAATMLKKQINALRDSTEAIVSGSFNTAVEVDCDCEVGGLADSFRKMVDRLNSNILRMNVLAYTDAVTKLPNRAVVFHLLQQITKNENGPHTAILFIDLDGFKQVNDRLGHDVGDEVLIEASRRIALGLGRNIDNLATCTTPLGELCDTAPDDFVVARIAGDEFVVLIPPTANPEAAEDMSKSILRELERPMEVADTQITIGASIGIANYPEDAKTPEEILSISDLAMYHAKRSGRNRAVLTTPALHKEWAERREVEADLRNALLNGEITLAYQPRFSADSLKILSAEGLARWNHPRRGNISPGVFVPIAERVGLIPLLGARVFETAVETIRNWRALGLELDLSVNISPAEFADPGLVKRLRAAMEKHALEPRQIELEITESIAMSDFETTKDQMQNLCRAGFRIAIDDFGTGFSNFSQLARLPFSALKLDRTLIELLDRDERSQAIVGAMITMAHTLGLTTVGEGVETMKQLQVLQSLGCDEVQGFLLARPMQGDKLLGLTKMHEAATDLSAPKYSSRAS